jgi:uncharacterized protein
MGPVLKTGPFDRQIYCLGKSTKEMLLRPRAEPLIDMKRRYVSRTVRFVLPILCLLLAAGPLIPPALALNIPGPTDIFYVADYAGVLGQDTIEHIVSQNDMLYEKTGAQIVVATVDFIGGADIEDYAYEMANEWGIGSAEKDNGILLLLVIGEENYWAVQGKGLESSLPSSTLGDLLYDHLEEDFAAGDYDAGVRKFFDALYAKLETIYGRIENDPVRHDPGYSDPGKSRNEHVYEYEFESDSGSFGLFSGAFGLLAAIPVIVLVILIIIIIAVVSSPFRRIRRGYYRRPYTSWRPWIFWGWGSHRHHHHHHRPPGPGPGPGSGPASGGGLFRGGGAGRSRPGGGFRSGGSRGGGFGGSRGGGGGSFRGGGAGRRK